MADRLGDLVSIPGGWFRAGSTVHEAERCVREWSTRLASDDYDVASFRSWIWKECPAYTVFIEPFRLMRFPVTNTHYHDFVVATGATLPESLVDDGSDPDTPVWGVESRDAEAFARWRAAQVGLPLRLPSEAEWEYAARGASRLEYPFGEVFDARRCNTSEAGINVPTRVDRYDAWPSPFDIVDMAGNVEEWTSTYYAPYPGGEWVDDDLFRLHAGRYRVMRGGSCSRNGDLARGARRHGPFLTEPFRYKGFRLACTV